MLIFFIKSRLVIFLYFYSDYIFEMPEGPKTGNPTCQEGSILGRSSHITVPELFLCVPAQVQERLSQQAARDPLASKTHASRKQVPQNNTTTGSLGEEDEF